MLSVEAIRFKAIVLLLALLIPSMATEDIWLNDYNAIAPRNAVSFEKNSKKATADAESRSGRVSALKVMNENKTSEQPNVDSISAEDIIEAQTTLNALRRSVAASNMQHVCWESVLQYFANEMVEQCASDLQWPDDFDDRIYHPARTTAYSLYSNSLMSPSDLIKYAHDKGLGFGDYKMVMQHDLQAFGCSSTYCPLIDNSTSTNSNFITACFFNYRADFSWTGPPYSSGAACSLCPCGTYCVDNLCYDPLKYLPQLNCSSVNLSNATSSDCSSSNPTPSSTSEYYTSSSADVSMMSLTTELIIVALMFLMLTRHY